MWYHENEICSFWLVLRGTSFIHIENVILLDVNIEDRVRIDVSEECVTSILD
jgi:hypothetical protein